MVHTAIDNVPLGLAAVDKSHADMLDRKTWRVVSVFVEKFDHSTI